MISLFNDPFTREKVFVVVIVIKHLHSATQFFRGALDLSICNVMMMMSILLLFLQLVLLLLLIITIMMMIIIIIEELDGIWRFQMSLTVFRHYFLSLE